MQLCALMKGQAETYRLLTGVTLSNKNVISCILGKLKPPLNKSIRNQAPRAPMQAYKIAKLPEEVIEAHAQSWGIICTLIY